MFIYKWLQQRIDERQCVLGRGLKISLQCIYAHKKDFANGDVLLLRMRFQVDCCWICKSQKDSCGRVECVLAGWVWKCDVLTGFGNGFGNILCEVDFILYSRIHPARSPSTRPQLSFWLLQIQQQSTSNLILSIRTSPFAKSFL